MSTETKEKMMNVLNQSARLIDFSWNKEKYRLMPAGKAVPVPEAAKKSTFLKALIKDGSVKVVSEEDAAAAELETLREQAESLGIEVNENWDAKKLTAEIKKKES